MEFGWGTQDLKPHENTKNGKDVLWLTGEIRRGDFNKFRTFTVDHLDEIVLAPPVISLSSNGGDVVEALQMAALIRSMYAMVYIGHNEKCASACFYLYVSAVNRVALDPRSIGIHRPYFDSTYFADLSPAAAEKRYAELAKTISDFLENSYVPRSIIEKMNATSNKQYKSFFKG